MGHADPQTIHQSDGTWSQPLNHRDLTLLSGTPGSTDWKEVRLIAGGGLVLGGSIGYAF